MTREDFELQNKNGTLRGVVTMPGGPPRATLVCLHGGPGGDLHGNSGIFDDCATAAIALDLATVQFSLYGAWPSDGQEQETCLRTQTQDYMSVLAYVQKRFGDTVFVVGESAGATVASRTWQPVKGHILLWPAFDLSDTDLGPYLTPEYRAAVEQRGFLDDNGVIIGKELFMELLLTDFSQAFTLPDHPVFMAHGLVDTEVPYRQSLQALERARGEVTFIASPTANHGFKTIEERRFLIDSVTRWLADQ